MSSLLNHILHFHGPWAYVLVGGLCFSECAFVVTFFIPGETALVFGGVLCSEHHVSLAPMIIVAVASTVIGYFVGFALGRVFGPRLLETPFLAKRAGVERTRQVIVERGVLAVVVARFIPVVRAFMPGVAGASGVELGAFAGANVAGGVVWATGYVLAGFLVGQAYRRFVHDATTVGELLAAVVVVLLIVHVVRSRRRH